MKERLGQNGNVHHNHKNIKDRLGMKEDTPTCVETESGGTPINNDQEEELKLSTDLAKSNQCTDIKDEESKESTEDNADMMYESYSDLDEFENYDDNIILEDT